MEKGELIEQLVAGTATIKVKRATSPGKAIAEVTTTSGTRFEVRLSVQIPRGQGQASIATYRTREEWPIEVLREKGYPLYWSRKWLLQELRNRKNIPEIALTSGFKAAELRRWKNRHNISGNPRHDLIREEFTRGDFASRRAAAAHYGLSEATLGKILDAPPHPTPEGQEERRRSQRG